MIKATTYFLGKSLDEICIFDTIINLKQQLGIATTSSSSQWKKVKLVTILTLSLFSKHQLSSSSFGNMYEYRFQIKISLNTIQ